MSISSWNVYYASSTSELVQYIQRDYSNKRNIQEQRLSKFLPSNVIFIQGQQYGKACQTKWVSIEWNNYMIISHWIVAFNSIITPPGGELFA